MLCADKINRVKGVQMKNGKRNDRREKQNYWKPGETLTSRDREMLHVVLQMYRTLGYTPTKQEVPNAGSLKKRFRTWKRVMEAAGLPYLNDSGQMRKKQKALEWKKGMAGL